MFAGEYKRRINLVESKQFNWNFYRSKKPGNQIETIARFSNN
jgi:hypothetical protein